MKAHTILLIEDNPSLAGEIADLLKMMKYEVVLANNGKVGLQIACKTPPDLIVTDLLMPEMGGLEMIKEIRSHKKLSQTPIIILTAKTDAEVDVFAAAHDVEQVIRKPSKAEFLIESVKRILSKHE